MYGYTLRFLLKFECNFTQASYGNTRLDNVISRLADISNFKFFSRTMYNFNLILILYLL